MHNYGPAIVRLTKAISPIDCVVTAIAVMVLVQSMVNQKNWAWSRVKRASRINVVGVVPRPCMSIYKHMHKVGSLREV